MLIQIACVNTKDAGKIMDVSVEVITAYAKQGFLQRVSVGSEMLVPLYEIASVRDITLKEVMNLTRKYGSVICLTWFEVAKPVND